MREGMSRREFVEALAGTGVIGILATSKNETGQLPRATPRLGMNLSGPADWNTELPFVDVFRLSRAWISQRRGSGWGEAPPLELDECGWVKHLEQ